MEGPYTFEGRTGKRPYARFVLLAYTLFLFLTNRKVDVFISTPSILSKYRRRQFPNIKTVVSGGEPCPQT